MRHVSKILFATILISFSFAQQSFADDDDPMDAVAKTQGLLRNASDRKEAIAGDSKAQALDGELSSLMGGSESGKQNTYELAADIFGKLGADAKGDPAKINSILEEARRNPAAFADKLTGDQKAKLKSIAEGIQAPSGARP